MLRILLALAALSLGLVLVTEAPAFACSCVQMNEQKQVDRADVVFVGTVTGLAKNDNEATYTVTATHAYKGVVERTTSVVSSASGASCGLEGIKVGGDYVFLARGEAAPLRANLCGGTGKATTKRIAAFEEVTGPGTEIAPPPPPTATRVHVEESQPGGFARTAAPGAAAVVVGMLGLLLVRWGSRRSAKG